MWSNGVMELPANHSAVQCHGGQARGWASWAEESSGAFGGSHHGAPELESSEPLNIQQTISHPCPSPQRGGVWAPHPRSSPAALWPQLLLLMLFIRSPVTVMVIIYQVWQVDCEACREPVCLPVAPLAALCLLSDNPWGVHGACLVAH